MDTLDWLLAGDPAIRWQTLRDLTDASDEEVAAARAEVATEGWGARLLAMRDADGQWAGGACFPEEARRPPRSDGPAVNGEWPQPWTSTLPVLDVLVWLGLEPGSAVAQEMVGQVAAHSRWEYDGSPFFDGEVEPCINGRTVAIGAYFGRDMTALADRVLQDQLDDGGWNCEIERGATVSSFASTIDVLDGLLAMERHAGSTAYVDARRRGEEYLLERRLFRSKRTGEVVEPRWLELSFPTRWYYDVLRGLDYFRAAGGDPDPRLEDAVEVVRGKQQPDGRWLLENTHPGVVPFELEGPDGTPSRGNTLRALRVLRWWDGAR